MSPHLSISLAAAMTVWIGSATGSQGGAGIQDRVALAPPKVERAGSAPSDPIVEAWGPYGHREWLTRAWASYKAKFVTADGRVVDDGNAGISHSEGQSYGLLLSVMSGDVETFDLIWRWTKTSLMVRPDGLIAWKWDPKAEVKVADRNNATDGDIIVAWALAEAAERFGRPDYRTAAAALARAIWTHAVRPSAFGPVFLPGVEGFDTEEASSGVVINLSYWVFPAFPVLKRLAPEFDWNALTASGKRLIKESQFGPLKLPSDWVVLGPDGPRPAAGFKPEFGYNAIRIPLYMAWAGIHPRTSSLSFGQLWSDDGDVGPFVTDVQSGAATETMGGNGFKMIAAVSQCAANTKFTIPDRLLKYGSDLYYPAALQIMSVVALNERYPKCL